MDEATEFIAAYNRPDFDAAVRLSDPEIAWMLQSSNSCRGRDQVDAKEPLSHSLSQT